MRPRERDCNRIKRYSERKQTNDLLTNYSKKKKTWIHRFIDGLGN